MPTPQNDWMAINLLNEEISYTDLMANNITPDNTILRDFEYYKNIPDVREKFTNSKGEFKEEELYAFYSSALSAYNDFTESNYIDLLVDAMEVHPNDWMNPTAKVRDTSATVRMIPDPFHRSMGQTGLWSVGEQPYSIRELAQSQKVVDYKTGEELDWSPNDHAGLFESLDDPTVVIATWDEDGTHIDEYGNEVEHYKGDLKLNGNGEFYYETLGDREAYDKDVLRWTDTFTIEGTWLNKYDFFDSDGLDKSITGTIFKTAFSLIPLFIPYVNYAYGAIGAAMAIGESAPTIFKALNASISGANTNSFGQAMTSWENYVYRFKDTESDYGRNNFMSFETIGQQIAGIGLQLYQQKFIAKAPQLINKILNSKNLLSSRVGQNLSLAFMAATSGADSYALFKNAGVSDRVSGIASLATIAGFFTLMNNNYYKSVLFNDTSWLNESSIMVNSLRNLNDEMLTAVKKVAGMNTERITRAEAEGIFKAFYRKAKSGWKKVFGKAGNATDDAARSASTASTSVKAGETHLSKNAGRKWYSMMLVRATNESFEEVGEEIMQDMIKGIVAGADALGWNVRKDEDTAVNFHFSVQDVVTRYLTAAIGGFVGGSIFEGFEQYEFMLSPQIRRLSDSTLSDGERIAYMLREYGVDHVLQQITRLEKQGVFGNKNLSLKTKKHVGLDGQESIIFEAADGDNNQNTQLANLLRTFVTSMNSIMNQYNMLLDSNALTGKIMPQMLHDAKLQILKDSSEWKDSRIDSEAEKEVQKRGGNYEEVRADLYSKYAYADTVITAMHQAGFFTSIQDFYTTLGRDLTILQMDYDNYEKSFFPTDKAKRDADLEEKWKNDETRKAKQKAIDDLVKKRDDLLSGKLNGYFVSKALMHANDDLLKMWDFNANPDDNDKSYLARSVQNYVKSRYGINYDSLGEEAKKYFEESWKELLGTDLHAKADAIYDIHMQMSRALGKEIAAISAELANKAPNKYFGSALHGGSNVIENVQSAITNLEDRLAQLKAQKQAFDDLLPDMLPTAFTNSNSLIKRLNLQDRVVVFNTKDELNTVASKLGFDPDSGAKGFYYDGKIYVSSENLKDSEMTKLILHEAVGHFGLKNLIEASGRTMFETMLSIYESAEDSVKAEIRKMSAAYSKEAEREFNQRKESEPELTLEQVELSLYTEEYIAKLAEKYSDDLLAESEKTFFGKILDFFKTLVSLITGENVTSEDDLVDLLKASLHGLKLRHINAVPTVTSNFVFGESIFKPVNQILPAEVTKMTEGMVIPDGINNEELALINALRTNSNFNSRQTICVDSVTELYNIVLGNILAPLINFGNADFSKNFILVSQENLDFDDARPDYIIINAISTSSQNKKELDDSFNNGEITKEDYDSALAELEKYNQLVNIAVKIQEDLGIEVIFAEELNGKFESNAIAYRAYDDTTETWIMPNDSLNEIEDSIKSYHDGSWLPMYKVRERLATGELQQFSQNLFGITIDGVSLVFLYGNADQAVLESELEALVARTPVIAIAPTDVEYTTSGLTLVANGDFNVLSEVVEGKIYSTINETSTNVTLNNLFNIPIKTPSELQQKSNELFQINEEIIKLNLDLITGKRLLNDLESEKVFTFGQWLTDDGHNLFKNFGEFHKFEIDGDKSNSGSPEIFWILTGLNKTSDMSRIISELDTFIKYYKDVDSGMEHSDNYFYESWRNNLSERLIPYLRERMVHVATSQGYDDVETIARLRTMVDSEFAAIKSVLKEQLAKDSEMRESMIIDILLQKGLDANLADMIAEDLMSDSQIALLFKRVSELNNKVFTANTRLNNEGRVNRWEPEVISLLKEFNALTGNSNSNLIEMIRRAYESYEGIQHIQEFSLNSTAIETEFIQLTPTINALMALLRGMISSGSIIDVAADPRSGFNEFANIYLSEEEQLPVLKDVDPKILQRQLESLDSRLRFLAGLSAQNGSRKIGLNQQMAVDRISDTYRKIEGFIESIKPRFSINATIPDLWDESGEYSYGNLSSAKVEDLEQIIKQGEIFEEKFIDALRNSDWNTLSNEDKVDLLLNYCNNSLFCGNFGKKQGFPEISLTETTTVLYLLSMLEVSSTDFNQRLVEAVSKTKSKAPFDSQIFAIRIADAFIRSKKSGDSLFKLFIERLDNLDKSKTSVDPSDYARTKIKNAIAIFGSAGTGKTSVVARLITEMNPDVKVFGTARYEPQQIKLQDSAKLDKTQIIDAVTLLESVLPDRNAKSKDSSGNTTNESANAMFVDGAAILKSNVKLNLNHEFLTKTFDPNNNNVVIVDELTLLSSLDWNILDEIAEKYNITYIALGDEKQNSSKDIRILHPDSKNPWWGDASDLKFLTVPTLTASFRTTNFAKDHNLRIIEHGLESSINLLKSDPKNWDDMHPLVADGDQPVVLDYLIDKAVYGEYITQSTTEFKSILDDIINSNSSSEIVIVVKDKESISKYNSYTTKNNVKIVTVDDIQGNEGDFFFFDNTYAPKNKDLGELLFAKYKEFYTMISRSKSGTVILDEGGYIKSELNVECIEKKDSSRTTNSSSSQYDDYANKFNRIYGQATSTPKPVETTPDDPVLPIRASIQHIGDMYLKLDDQQVKLIDSALERITTNDIIKYGDGINPLNNKLCVKFGNWNLSFIKLSDQWVPIDSEGTILFDWNNNPILQRLSLKLSNISSEDKAWNSQSIVSSTINTVIEGLKTFVEEESLNKYTIKSDTNEDNDTSAHNYLKRMRERSNTFFVDDYNDYIDNLPIEEKKLGIFNSDIENNVEKLNRAYKYISSVVRDIESFETLNAKIQLWIENNVDSKYASALLDALSSEPEFYYKDGILHFVVGDLRIPVLKIHKNSMFVNDSYYHGYLTKLKNCVKVTTFGEGVYDIKSFQKNYLTTFPIIVAADKVKVRNIVGNDDNKEWLLRNNGKSFVLLTDALYADPELAWEADAEWNHSWKSFGSVVGTQRIISISQIIRLSLLTGMIYRGKGHFNQYRDKYAELFGETIDSPAKASEELNNYMGYDVRFKPITDKLEGDALSEAITHNYKILSTQKLLDNASHEKLISALIKELEKQPTGYVYNGLHDLVRRKTVTRRSKATRGGYQIRFGNYKFVLLLDQKASRSEDQFVLYSVTSTGQGSEVNLKQIGLKTFKGSTYLQDALALAKSYLWSSEGSKSNLTKEDFNDQLNSLETIIPVVEYSKNHIGSISTPETILALLTDLDGIDVRKLNDDMMAPGKHPEFKRGLYMNLVSPIESYIDTHDFYKEYKMRPDTDSPMTSDIVKMIGSIYEAVGSKLIAGRKSETTIEEYYDVPKNLENTLRDKNLWEKVSTVVANTEEEWLFKANNILKNDGFEIKIMSSDTNAEFEIVEYFNTAMFKEVTNEQIIVDEKNSHRNRIVGTTESGDYALALNSDSGWRAIIIPKNDIDHVFTQLSTITQELLDEGDVRDIDGEPHTIDSFSEEIHEVINQILLGKTNIEYSLEGDSLIDELDDLYVMIDNISTNIKKINCK